MKRTKEFIKRNIAGEIVLVPSGQTAREFNGMVTLTEDFQWKFFAHIWPNIIPLRRTIIKTYRFFKR